MCGHTCVRLGVAYIHTYICTHILTYMLAYSRTGVPDVCVYMRARGVYTYMYAYICVREGYIRMYMHVTLGYVCYMHVRWVCILQVVLRVWYMYACMYAYERGMYVCICI